MLYVTARAQLLDPILKPSIRWSAAVLCAICLLTAVVTPPPAAPARAATSSPVASAPRRVSWSVTGGAPNAELGSAVARAGDVNGDGFDDVIVGAPRYSDSLEQQGQASVFLGSATGLQAAPYWSAMGGSGFAHFGAAVATAGDINHDGKSDFIVGAPGFNDGSGEVGRVHVYYGSATGISGTPDWSVTGSQDRGEFGDAVAGRFDVNGDGYGDVLVGAPNQEAGVISFAGCAYAYFGSQQGLASSPSWSACGIQADEYYGAAVAAAGDVNGDLVDDIAVGAPSYSNGQPGEGRVYIYHGSKSAVSTAASWTAESNEAHARFGCAVAGAGDVNKDSFADLIVGANNYSGAHDYEGRAYLYRGSSSGLAAAASWTVEGGQAYSGLGETVASAWDIDDDGYSDIAVGGSEHDGVRPNEGRVRVYSGSADGLATTPAWTAAGPQSGSWFGSAIGAGYFDGDGLADIVVGAPSYSADFLWEGAAFAYMGGTPPGSEFVVDSPADDADSADAVHGDGSCADAMGRCTFRAALQEANRLDGPDLVTFSQAMTVTVDGPLGALPHVIEQLTIDASSTWDHVGDRPGVVLDGAGGSFDGLQIQADSVEVFGITVTGFGQKGIIVAGANNAIGGPGMGQRNVIGGNANEGVVLWGEGTDRNIVQANFIGVAHDGLTTLPNQVGIWVAFGASWNLIGAEDPTRDNVISGNTHGGITIEGDDTDYNWVMSNVIGLSQDLSTAVGNYRGVLVRAGPYGTSVGWPGEMPLEAPVDASAGPDSAAKHGWPLHGRQPRTERGPIGVTLDDDPSAIANHIGGNVAEGVRVQGDGGFTGIEGNVITDNGAPGIAVDRRPSCRIAFNVVTRNEGAGVEVSGSEARAVSISGNQIWDNFGEGISLRDGANGGIAPPTINQANSAGAAGTACSECVVQVFSDASDEGELPELLAEAEPDGSWVVIYPLRGPNVTAICSDAGNASSEFSAPFAIAAVPTPTPTSTSASTSTPTASATTLASATSTTSATSTASPSSTTTATTAPSATPTPTAAPTDTATVEATPSPEPTMAATATPTAPTEEPTESATPTPSADASSTPSPTPMLTPGSEYQLYAPLLLNGAIP